MPMVAAGARHRAGPEHAVVLAGGGMCAVSVCCESVLLLSVSVSVFVSVFLSVSLSLYFAWRVLFSNLRPDEERRHGPLWHVRVQLPEHLQSNARTHMYTWQWGDYGTRLRSDSNKNYTHTHTPCSLSNCWRLLLQIGP